MNLCSENGPSARLIEDVDLCKNLKRKIIQEWPMVKNPDNFPGPQPVSLEREYIWKLSHYPYSVCEKTDGMRFMLVADIINGQYVCAMVDRAFRFYEVDVQTQSEKLCLLDGELVCESKGDNSWTFYAYDAIVVNGLNCSKQPLDVRHRYMSSFVASITDPPFAVKAKRFWSLGDLPKMMESFAESPLEHESDGLIFTPQRLPVGTGTQMSLVKWKPHHTFDFKVQVKRGANNKTRYDLYSTDRGKIVKHSSINERTRAGRMFHDKYTRLTHSPVAIVECEWNVPGGFYEPLLERVDKTYPNSVRTVEKTHLNIRENVTLEELVDLSKGIK